MIELNVSEKLVVNEIRHAITKVKQNKNGIGHTCYLYIQISGKEKIDQPGMVTKAWPFIFPFINLKAILGACFSWNLMKRETKSASDVL